jgi:uncharacterized protein (DUF1501 family)
MSRQTKAHDRMLQRRTMLRIGAASVCGLTLADALASEAVCAAEEKRRARNVILVWLSGGPSTIDMWDLKPDAPAEIRGEFKPIDTSVPGLRICEHLPLLAAVMNRLTLIRSLHHSIPEHGQGTRYLLTGNRPTPALEHPALGAVVARLGPGERGVPPYVEFGRQPASNAGFLGAAYNPFRVGEPARGAASHALELTLREGLAVEEFADRVALRERFDQAFRALDGSDLPESLSRFQEQAVDILRSGKTSRALDLAAEKESIRTRYGTHAVGSNLLAARRLIEAGVRFVTVSAGGWDTHSANFRTLRDRLLPPLDQALSALVTDLDERGMLDATIVLCAGEFGRTPQINNAAGRDHWARAMAVVAAGGGFPQACVYGDTAHDGTAPTRAACTPDDLAATLYHQLGIDPRRQVLTASGRPVDLVREGRVLRDLVA